MGRTDEASLVIAAPAADIYRALVDPAATAQWLPPDGMAGTVEQWDPVPGGAFRITLRYPTPGAGKSTADSDVVRGRFVELVPDERMVQAVMFDADDPAYAGVMVMSWLLSENDDDAPVSTTVTIRADDVPPGISADDHQVGLTSSLANLAAHVTRRP